MEFCKKKQEKVTEKFFSDFEQGNAYAYLDIKRETNFFVAFTVGKWIQEKCDELYYLIEKRTEQPTFKNKISFCTDGNDQNSNAILKYFHKDSVNYGQKIKDKIQQKIIGMHQRKVFGNISFSEIKINMIDGFCSKLRARVGCFVRKTRNFAKKRRLIRNVLHITQTSHNFIEPKKQKTPAMKEGLTKKIFTWNDVFNKRLSINI